MGGEGFSGSATEKEQPSTTMDSDIKVSHIGIAIRLINSFAEQLFRFSPFFFCMLRQFFRPPSSTMGVNCPFPVLNSQCVLLTWSKTSHI